MNFISIKKLIIKILLKIPLVRNIISYSGRYRKRTFEKKESIRILNSLDVFGAQKTLIVYDYSISPPTFGDYFGVVMLARYFVTLEINVDFVIIDGQYRDDWGLCDKKSKSEMILMHIKTAKLILDKSYSNIEILQWMEFKEKYFDLVDSKLCFPVRDGILTRTIPLYTHAYNIVNYLCAEHDKDFIDKFLLSHEMLIDKVEITMPTKPYITWGCRYSKVWGKERNLTEIEFLKIYQRLRNLYPDHEIMIVSDMIGCEYFKRIASQNNIQCLFSKNYSNNLFSDGVLILGSTYFYILRGGGISVFPQFSRVPHERVTYLMHESIWSDGRGASWASNDQVYRPLLPGKQFDSSYLPTISSTLN
jgi:hypothetical protein